jgi:hypothetical protein
MFCQCSLADNSVSMFSPASDGSVFRCLAIGYRKSQRMQIQAVKQQFPLAVQHRQLNPVRGAIEHDEIGQSVGDHRGTWGGCRSHNSGGISETHRKSFL